MQDLTPWFGFHPVLTGRLRKRIGLALRVAPARLKALINSRSYEVVVVRTVTIDVRFQLRHSRLTLCPLPLLSLPLFVQALLLGLALTQIP